MAPVLLVGTRKGLFVLSSDEDRRDWEVSGPAPQGLGGLPRRSPTPATAPSTPPRTASSTARPCTARPIVGETWTRAEELGLPEEAGLTLEKTWHVGRDGEDGRLWLGGAPGVLFRSDDSGETWHTVASLVGPSAGQVEPGRRRDVLPLHPARSRGRTANVRRHLGRRTFRTEDGGESWELANSGVAADFFPDNVSGGRPVRPQAAGPPRGAVRLWQQNHCGVYRSDDHGRTWERLEGNGLPSGFGFPIMLDPADPDSAFVIPEEGAENRVTPGGRLGVYRTRDGGASAGSSRRTGSLSRPGSPCSARRPPSTTTPRTSARRAAPCSDDDRGDSWSEARRSSPPILSVEAADWQ